MSTDPGSQNPSSGVFKTLFMCLHSSDNIIEQLSLDFSVIAWINSLVKRIHRFQLPFLGRSIHNVLFLRPHQYSLSVLK